MKLLKINGNQDYRMWILGEEFIQGLVKDEKLVYAVNDSVIVHFPEGDELGTILVFRKDPEDRDKVIGVILESGRFDFFGPSELSSNSAYEYDFKMTRSGSYVDTKSGIPFRVMTGSRTLCKIGDYLEIDNSYLEENWPNFSQCLEKDFDFGRSRGIILGINCEEENILAIKIVSLGAHGLFGFVNPADKRIKIVRSEM